MFDVEKIIASFVIDVNPNGPTPGMRIVFDPTAGPGAAKWMDDAFKADLEKAEQRRTDA